MNTPQQAMLEQKRLRILRSLPSPANILRASIVKRSLRCGGAGCRCVKGKKHSATYLITSHPGGRTEHITLPAHLIPVARRWVAVYWRWRRAMEQISAINRRLLRQRWVDVSGRSSAMPARR